MDILLLGFLKIFSFSRLLKYFFGNDFDWHDNSKRVFLQFDNGFWKIPGQRGRKITGVSLLCIISLSIEHETFTPYGIKYFMSKSYVIHYHLIR